MLHATSKKNAPKSSRRKIHFPGISADARKLNVNRVTLWRTLTGEWNLPGLRSRYEKMKEGK